jgi:dystonin
MPLVCRETQTFVIKGVIDPRTKEEVSIYQAIHDGIISQAQGLYVNPKTGESMPIPEAMNKGLILVEFTNKTVETGELIKRGIIKTTTTEECISYSVLGVVDPVTGKKLSISEAIDKGIIDPKTGRYVNPLTGATMTLSDAIEKGLLDVEEKSRVPRNNNNGENGEDGIDGDKINGNDDSSEQYLDQDLVILGVMDPRTGKVVSLDEAEKLGLVDIDQGVYVDPITRELVPLEDAIKRGMLRARLAHPERDATNPNVVRAKLLKLNPDAETVEQMLEPQLVIALQSSADTNHNVFEKLQEGLDTELGGIVEQISGQEMSVAEAFEAGVLRVDALSVENANGERYTLQQAAALGLVDPNTTREILKAIEPLSLQHLIESKELNPKNGDFVDVKARTSMPLSDAISQGKIDPDQVFYMERPTHTIMSLSKAIDDKKWDADEGTVTDVRTGEQTTLQQAIDDRIIEPMIDAEKLATQIASLKFLKGFMDTGIVGVKNTALAEEVSVEDAVLDDILDIPNVEYQHLEAKEIMPLQRAVAEEYVQPKVGRKLFEAMGAMALGEALMQSQLDPATGKFVHPETGRKMTIRDAIDKGFLDPNTVFFVDPKTDNVRLSLKLTRADLPWFDTCVVLTPALILHIRISM